MSFRPLARYIGLYQELMKWKSIQQEFPSPREVYRFISNLQISFRNNQQISFRPLARYIGLYQLNKILSVMQSFGFRPLSRYIGLYQAWNLFNNDDITLFPSPREVYRFISSNNIANGLVSSLSFRPLARYIGLYLSGVVLKATVKSSVSVPSRGI